MEIVFFFFYCLSLNIHGKFDGSYQNIQVNICSHLVNNCELVALDKNSATTLHSLKGRQSIST